jgi:hypothetical protein
MTINVTKNGVKYVENEEGNIIKKSCTKCDDMKNIEEFPKQKHGFGRTEAQCKICKKSGTQFNRLIKDLKNRLEKVNQ